MYLVITLQKIKFSTVRQARIFLPPDLTILVILEEGKNVSLFCPAEKDQRKCMQKNNKTFRRILSKSLYSPFCFSAMFGILVQIRRKSDVFSITMFL